MDYIAERHIGLVGLCKMSRLVLAELVDFRELNYVQNASEAYIVMILTFLGLYSSINETACIIVKKSFRLDNTIVGKSV